MEEIKNNPLGTEKISGLMIRFAIPSIIAMVIGSVYNIIDQLFIGNAVGTLGNAATNVVFPLTTLCVGLALLLGVGGAACFNLTMGRGEPEKAGRYVGNSLVLQAISGVALCVVTQVFMGPLLQAFGTPDNVMPYAVEYLRVTAIGFPFLILTTGGGHLMRADGSPRMTMFCSVIGAVINTGLDALFVLVFGWGMFGAALATIIGQIISALIVVYYMARRFKTVSLRRSDFKLSWAGSKWIMQIGTSPFVNQMCNMVIQISMNKLLTIYGAQSIYGEAIPLACCGIVMKVYSIFLAIIIGLSQGAQPIESYNYGAKQYKRVRDAYWVAMGLAFAISIVAFIFFRVYPRQILMWFGSNSEEYFEFGVLFFRVFLLFAWLIFLQPLTANFFTAIGKPNRGVFLSLTRQMIFFMPLMFLLPLRFGIMGLLYTAPIADFLSVIVALVMVIPELRRMKQMEAELATAK